MEIAILLLNKQEKLFSLPILTRVNKKLKNIIDKNDLLKKGFIYNLTKFKPMNQNSDIKVVYAVHNSLPETNNGYAIRTHYIAKAVKSLGIDIYPVTRVGFPYDLPNIHTYFESREELNIDFLQYSRLDKSGYRWDENIISKYLKNYALMLASFSVDKQASIIHSASSYINGLAAINAGKILNIPSIYEVRGFWEITRASREKGFLNSDSFRMQKRLEIQACRDATTIIALSDIVKEELIKRGIQTEKIYVVPNGVDTNKIVPQIKNQQILSKFGWNGNFIVGFIGSVVDYEGLPLLVKAAKKIEKLGYGNLRYLIIGDGNDLENLKQEVQKQGLSQLFIFTGRVPYKDVEKYYSVIDIACYPRLNWEVCSIVSPKKPFESMSYGIPIISSSIRANSYFIEDGETGLIHDAENIDSMVEKILFLYNNEELRDTMALKAREWVIKNRDSSITGKLLKKVYSETLIKFYKENRP